MMAADLVAAVAADAFCVVSLDSVFLHRQGLCRADADTFPAQHTDFWIEDRALHCQVFDKTEGPFRHIVPEHGGIVEMADKAVVFYKEIICFLKRVVDCLFRFKPEAALKGLGEYWQ